MDEGEMMIESERLILRSFEESDAQDVFEYLKEPEVHCFACMKLNTLDEAKAETIKKSKDKEFLFAIVLKENGKVIGEIEAHPESSQPDKAENFVLDTYSPCWMLNKEYQGKGYAYNGSRLYGTLRQSSHHQSRRYSRADTCRWRDLPNVP